MVERCRYECQSPSLDIGCYFLLKHLSLGRLLLEVGTVYKHGELTLNGEPVEELFMSPQAAACFSLYFLLTFFVRHAFQSRTI